MKSRRPQVGERFGDLLVHRETRIKNGKKFCPVATKMLPPRYSQCGACDEDEALERYEDEMYADHEDEAFAQD